MSNLTELDFQVLFGDHPPALQEIYTHAMEHLDLPAHHPHLINDIITMSGSTECQNDAAFHVLLIALLRSLVEGSVCLSMAPEALRQSLDFLPEELANEYTERIPAGLPGYRKLDRIISDGITRQAPLIVREHQGHSVLFFQRYHRAEEQLKRILGEFIESPPLQVTESDVRAFNVGTEKRGDMELGDEQKLAVAMALCQRFVVVSGGPGTGKTTVVLSMIRAFLVLGISPGDIRLAAPTGRAANRMAESIRGGMKGEADDPASTLEASTIHRLLGFKPGMGHFTHNHDNPLPLKVLILDEASMVDISLMARVLEAVPQGARVILLGDRDQLPSVEAGAMLSDLLSAPRGSVYTKGMKSALGLFPGMEGEQNAGGPGHPMADHLTILEKTHRFNESMRQVSRRIADGEEEVVDVMLKATDGHRFIPLPEGREAGFRRDFLAKWFGDHFSGASDGRDVYIDLVQRAVDGYDDTLRSIFQLLAANRVLSLTHSGPAGVSAVNRVFLEMLRARLPGDLGSGIGFPPGTPIINTRNDHARRLYNGDTGVVLRDGNGNMRGWFESPGGAVSWPLEELPTIEPAFAMTVHKAQGSEYGEVLLLLPPSGEHRLLGREIVYTGLTRARREAVILGSRESLVTALRRRMNRFSTIPGWLADRQHQ
ncbi:MAG: exodeoxyribonuclease V subunit alpha [Candidatus Sumerlaeia bacterium]|nr:exodeoxyribonuclease V subunit alpha [Candidatus Sumerlaeia bacterium]